MYTSDQLVPTVTAGSHGCKAQANAVTNLSLLWSGDHTGMASVTPPTEGASVVQLPGLT